jgi:osmotically-inducible protein OsmY
VLGKVLWVEPSEVNVNVDDGVVTLTGTMDRKSMIGVAVALTRGVDGVVDELKYRYDDTADVKASRLMTP